MDPATLIGVIGALVFIVVANVMEGGNPMSLMLLPPILLVVGGTIMSDRRRHDRGRQARRTRSVKAFTGSVGAPPPWSRPGLAWPRRPAARACSPSRTPLRDVDDPFLSRASPSPSTAPTPRRSATSSRPRSIAVKAEAKQAAKFFDAAGAYAPTIGIIGTVMGLVHVLENLAEPEKLGHLIAGAFVATLWGVMSANVFFLPVGARITRLGELEAPAWSSSSRASPPSRPARTRGSSRRSSSSLLPADQQHRGGGLMSGPGRRKKHEEHEEHENHERWLVTYADMLTLLMVLFIVMFAMSQVDQKKYNALKSGLAEGFGQPTAPS